jgi:hypothetical protein
MKMASGVINKFVNLLGLLFVIAAVNVFLHSITKDLVFLVPCWVGMCPLGAPPRMLCLWLPLPQRRPC